MIIYTLHTRKIRSQRYNNVKRNKQIFKTKKSKCSYKNFKIEILIVFCLLYYLRHSRIYSLFYTIMSRILGYKSIYKTNLKAIFAKKRLKCIGWKPFRVKFNCKTLIQGWLEIVQMRESRSKNALQYFDDVLAANNRNIEALMGKVAFLNYIQCTYKQYFKSMEQFQKA